MACLFVFLPENRLMEIIDNVAISTCLYLPDNLREYAGMFYLLPSIQEGILTVSTQTHTHTYH